MSRRLIRIPLPNLYLLFDEINEEHFGGYLPSTEIRWNTRIRTSAGRFIPGTRGRNWGLQHAIIEIAAYLLEEEDALHYIKDTLAHEMVHYWLWWEGRAFGHTPEFLQKLKEIGASRYNPVPRSRPFKYVYQCPGCLKKFQTKKVVRNLACKRCCAAYSQGRYHEAFALKLVEHLGKPQALGKGPARRRRSEA